MNSGDQPPPSDASCTALRVRIDRTRGRRVARLDHDLSRLLSLLLLGEEPRSIALLALCLLLPLLAQGARSKLLLPPKALSSLRAFSACCCLCKALRPSSRVGTIVAGAGWTIWAGGTGAVLTLNG